jgi:hypothetical protein
MMTDIKGIITAGALFYAGACALAATPPGGAEFDRYQAILDRKIFGEIVPAETATNIVPTETLTKELEMRAIIDDGNSLRVGFLDKKTNKLFYLVVGEQNEGYELVSVNYDNEEAVLKKGAATTVFMLKPNKTPTAPGAADKAQGFPQTPGIATPGFALPGVLGAAPAQGLTPITSSGSKNPFFTDLKKKKFSPFKPLGTNAPTPFHPQSIESFMKANTNASPGFPGQGTPFFSPVTRTEGKGETIDNLLRANPNASGQFSPFLMLDTNAANHGTQKSAVEGFGAQNENEPQPSQAPAFFTIPATGDSEEVYEE